MIVQKHITNINALQTVSLLRFLVFFIISILLTKIGYTQIQIGEFEMTILIINTVSFFWVYAIIHSLMTLYNNNASFSDITRNRKSPELFNAFIIISGISTLLILIFLILKNYLNLFGESVGHFPYCSMIVLNIFFSNPSCLIEYVYVLRNKPIKTLTYGFVTYSIILISVSLPLILGLGIKTALWCLTGTSFFRFIWLMVLLKKNAALKISFTFLKEHLKLAYPLALSYFLSGSAEYIDNLIISLKYGFGSLAIFRYGAKELPFSTGMANGLNSSMIKEFSTPEKIQKSIGELKKKSKRLMHILFPISIVLLLMANILYRLMYRSDFGRSSDIFMVYLLLIMSRLLFPHTILIGLKQTKVVLWASLIAIILNIILSLFLMQYRGTVGVALATVVVYFLEKIVLMWFTYKRYGIKPQEYTPLYTFLIYTTILIVVFTLIDKRIIHI
jgi:O-antigen/teichoic acid export membrane protein